MAKECFMLERVRPLGTFVFEYSSSAKKYCYFSYKASGVLHKKQLKELISELRLVYNLSEPVRINTALIVYRYEPTTVKGKVFLDELAQRHGLTEFSHEGYADALRKERDRIILSDYKKLAIIFGIVTLLFAAGIFALWYSAFPCAFTLFLCVMNLVRFLSVKAYIKHNTATRLQ